MKPLDLYLFMFKDLTKPLVSKDRYRTCVIRASNELDAKKKFNRIYKKCEITGFEKVV